MRNLLVIFGLIFFSSCISILDSSERKELRQKKKCIRKYDRYVKNCPDYIRVDTLLLPVSIELDSQFVSKSFQTNQDTATLDSLLRRLEAAYSSMDSTSDGNGANSANVIYRDIIRHVKNKRCIEGVFRIDTSISIMINGSPTQFKVYAEISQPDGSEIKATIGIPDQEFTTTTEVLDEKIIKPELTWKEKLHVLGNRVGMLLGLVLVILAIIWIVKKALKTYF